MKLIYTNPITNKKTQIGEILTNHSFTVYEAVDFIGLPDNSPAKYIDDDGILCVDYDNIKMIY